MASSAKPAVSSSSVSSRALSSRVWNGLIGVSRPGAKVIRLGGAQVRDRRLVVVEPDHLACHLGDQVRAIPLSAAGLQHVTTGASVA
jgi:hypothetical protein